MIDTISGAKASSIIYSLVETAKANNLNVYEYIKHVLTVIPNHMEDTDRRFCENSFPGRLHYRSAVIRKNNLPSPSGLDLGWYRLCTVYAIIAKK